MVSAKIGSGVPLVMKNSCGIINVTHLNSIPFAQPTNLHGLPALIVKCQLAILAFIAEAVPHSAVAVHPLNNT
jgi:hypothetical protein